MRKNPDLAAVADVMDRLSLWLRRQVPSAMSSSSITTLYTLNSDGPLRISDLAAREALTQPGMTTVVNRLEALGHAERVPDPTDGRAALVRITAAGRAMLAERHAARTETLQNELHRLNADDQSALAAALPALERLINRDTKKAEVSA
jgi:DNA-binding MarR family transcriptional regulator